MQVWRVFNDNVEESERNSNGYGWVIDGFCLGLAGNEDQAVKKLINIAVVCAVYTCLYFLLNMYVCLMNSCLSFIQSAFKN